VENIIWDSQKSRQSAKWMIHSDHNIFGSTANLVERQTFTDLIVVVDKQ